MSLSVVVYDTISNIKNKYSLDDSMLEVDNETGEVYLNEDNEDKIKNFQNVIIEKFLGNTSDIAYLHDTLIKCLKKDSIIIAKILYNGSHSGDVIEIFDISKMNNEISIIKDVHANDNLINEFINRLTEVIDSSLSCNKPIVFL